MDGKIHMSDSQWKELNHASIWVCSDRSAPMPEDFGMFELMHRRMCFEFSDKLNEETLRLVF